MSKQQILLKQFQSPGDILVLTAAVRDLHRAHPGRYETWVQTTNMELWNNNPFVTPVWKLNGQDRSELCEIECKNVGIDFSNQRPGHYIGQYHEFLEMKLGVKIPITEFHGDLHLSEIEKKEQDVLGKYWVMVAGGKTDFTTKLWPSDFFQEVVYMNPHIQFVQVGKRGDLHKPLHNVIDALGGTNIRQLISLVYHAEGVICPVTFAMHLAAAVPPKDYKPEPLPSLFSKRYESGPNLKPCVVIAGGREAPHWEAYPGHRFLDTVGTMKCCAHGGCYKARVKPLNDGSRWDRKEFLCSNATLLGGIISPTCLINITPSQVSEAINSYYKGGILNTK